MLSAKKTKTVGVNTDEPIKKDELSNYSTHPFLFEFAGHSIRIADNFFY